jgi:ADP-ribose pyrophosphatase YjhB (NUDIX family)
VATPLESMARFCERCGVALVNRTVEERLRPCCPACNFVAYLDPKVAAGVIVTLNDEVVLLKRNIEPGLGKWVFPGGYVDAGEPPEKAAVRETWEEVGLEVGLEDLLGVFSVAGERVILVVFMGHATGGVLQGNFESQAVETFAHSDIPWDELAFVTTTDALKTYMTRRASLQ